MRNTKAKRAKAFLENRGYEYVSCKKLENQYEIMAYDPILQRYIRYTAVFADTMIIIQYMETGNIQFMADGDPIQLMDIVEG